MPPNKKSSSAALGDDFLARIDGLQRSWEEHQASNPAVLGPVPDPRPGHDTTLADVPLHVRPRPKGTTGTGSVADDNGDNESDDSLDSERRREIMRIMRDDAFRLGSSSSSGSATPPPRWMHPSGRVPEEVTTINFNMETPAAVVEAEEQMNDRGSVNELLTGVSEAAKITNMMDLVLHAESALGNKDAHQAELNASRALQIATELDDKEYIERCNMFLEWARDIAEAEAAGEFEPYWGGRNLARTPSRSPSRSISRASIRSTGWSPCPSPSWASTRSTSWSPSPSPSRSERGSEYQSEPKWEEEDDDGYDIIDESDFDGGDDEGEGTLRLTRTNTLESLSDTGSGRASPRPPRSNLKQKRSHRYRPEIERNPAYPNVYYAWKTNSDTEDHDDDDDDDDEESRITRDITRKRPRRDIASINMRYTHVIRAKPIYKPKVRSIKPKVLRATPTAWLSLEGNADVRDPFAERFWNCHSTVLLFQEGVGQLDDMKWLSQYESSPFKVCRANFTFRASVPMSNMASRVRTTKIFPEQEWEFIAPEKEWDAFKSDVQGKKLTMEFLEWERERIQMAVKEKPKTAIERLFVRFTPPPIRGFRPLFLVLAPMIFLCLVVSLWLWSQFETIRLDW